MQPARIGELLEPFLGSADDRRLTANDLQHISTYIDILKHWNARINLTAIRSEEEIVTRHFGESFFAARHFFPGSFSGPSASSVLKALEVADLGSGAGFPGIPLKLWSPQIHLTLIESHHKKATFLREAARALTLTDINIYSVRAETLPPNSFDLVTLRAVERFERFLPVAAHLVAQGGRLALLIGLTQLEVAKRNLPDLCWSAPLSVPGSDSRILSVGSKQRLMGEEQESGPNTPSERL